MSRKRKRTESEAGPSANTRSRGGAAMKNEPDDEAESMPWPSTPPRRNTIRRSVKRAVRLRESEALGGQAPGIMLQASSKDDSDGVLGSPSKRAKRLIVNSDDDEADSKDYLGFEETKRGNGDSGNRIRRIKVEDEEEEEVSPSTGKQRKPPTTAFDSEHTRRRILRRTSDADDSSGDGQAGDDRVSTPDSADENDLHLSPPPAPKPTAQVLKKAKLDKYKIAREVKSSPTSIRIPKVEETDEDEPLAWVSDSDETDSNDSNADTGSQDESSENENLADFIVPDETTDAEGDADAKVETALGPEYYVRLPLATQFTSFVEFLVGFHFDPDILNKVPDKDRWRYEASKETMRKRTKDAAASLLLPTWSKPFRMTLDDRPILIGPAICELGDCQVCWTRGSRACNHAGCLTLSTLEGFYDPKTFEEESETHVKYGQDTTVEFKNSALADPLHYPPGFRLVVGERCAYRAVKYHQAQHYLYNMFTRVKHEIKRQCHEYRDLKRTHNRGLLLEALTKGNEHHEGFIPQLWNNFVLDSAQWSPSLIPYPKDIVLAGE
ncbi:hypothetical protein K438DRAFT_1970475 [Mycena galopus ATCC 62051]|nr:hypothetical protein K438DRAFT_1970475 [Mycena galopus ATCC 62051]